MSEQKQEQASNFLEKLPSANSAQAFMADLLTDRLSEEERGELNQVMEEMYATMDNEELSFTLDYKISDRVSMILELSGYFVSISESNTQVMLL